MGQGGASSSSNLSTPGSGCGGSSFSSIFDRVGQRGEVTKDSRKYGARDLNKYGQLDCSGTTTQYTFSDLETDEEGKTRLKDFPRKVN